MWYEIFIFDTFIPSYTLKYWPRAIYTSLKMLLSRNSRNCTATYRSHYYFFIFVLILPPFSVIRMTVWCQACFFNTIGKTMGKISEKLTRHLPLFDFFFTLFLFNKYSLHKKQFSPQTIWERPKQFNKPFSFVAFQ